MEYILNNKASLIDFPVVANPSGDLSFIEGSHHIPFEIKRVFYTYNLPVNSQRGGHAHHQLEEIIFALSGSFRTKLDDGKNISHVWLNNPRQGLYIKKRVWIEMDNFSQGAVCMALCSLPYDESDYMRDYNEFLDETQKST